MPESNVTQRLTQLEVDVSLLKEQLRRIIAARPAPVANTNASLIPTPQTLEPADDADLDSEWGNPEIKRDAPRYKGPSMIGRRYSEADPKWLDAEVSFKLWCAAKDTESGAVTGTGKPTAPFKLRDARRAAGWARRIRAEQTALLPPDMDPAAWGR